MRLIKVCVVSSLDPRTSLDPVTNVVAQRDPTGTPKLDTYDIVVAGNAHIEPNIAV